jgi:hypothetical protein
MKTQTLTKILHDYKNENITEEVAKYEIKILYKKQNPYSFDFITEILQLFQKAFYEKRGYEYEIVNQGKQRNAIGKLLRLYKQKKENLYKNSADCKRDFINLFNQCLLVSESDNYHYERMSPAHIFSEFNVLKAKLKNGKQQRKYKELDQIEKISFD